MKPLEIGLAGQIASMSIHKVKHLWGKVSFLVAKKATSQCAWAFQNLIPSETSTIRMAAEIFENKLSTITKVIEQRMKIEVTRGFLVMKLMSKLPKGDSRMVNHHGDSASSFIFDKSSRKSSQADTLAKLRTELQGLLEAEESINRRLVAVQQEARKISDAETSPRYSMDATLELLILDKEIGRITGENKQLRRELTDANQDTGLLLRQVNELLAASEARIKPKKEEGPRFGRKEYKD